MHCICASGHDDIGLLRAVEGIPLVGEVHITMRHWGRERRPQPWVPFGVGSGVVGVEINEAALELKGYKETHQGCLLYGVAKASASRYEVIFSHRLLARSAPWKTHCSSGCSTRPRISSAASTSFLTFYLRICTNKVEPRGFEPLTSAVQRRYELSGCVLARPPA